MMYKATSNQRPVGRKITKQDLEIRLLELSKSSGNLTGDFLQYCLSNYDHLTPEAQKSIDDAFEKLNEYYEEKLVAMPDSIKKRKMKRLVRQNRLIAEGFIEGLETTIDDTKFPEIHKKTREYFIKYIQIIMDLYQDIMENTFSGRAVLCKLNLLGICIDELLVAFHLSQRSYVGQSFAHLRTIQECNDLIELFNKEPSWADFWTSDIPSKEKWKKLKPSEVRKKLGKGQYFKKVYSFLSDSGSHPSFEMLIARCKEAAKLSPKGNPQISISIGGTSKTKEAIGIHIFIFFLMIMVLAQIIIGFKEYLNLEEIIEILKTLDKDAEDYIKEFPLKPREDSEQDIYISDLGKSMLDMKEKLLKVLV